MYNSRTSMDSDDDYNGGYDYDGGADRQNPDEQYYNDAMMDGFPPPSPAVLAKLAKYIESRDENDLASTTFMRLVRYLKGAQTLCLRTAADFGFMAEEMEDMRKRGVSGVDAAKTALNEAKSKQDES